MARGDKCQLCHQVIHDTTGHYCQKCYMYLKRHPEGLYKLPPKGVVAYATNGDTICHICGKAYSKLGNHIYQCHHLTQKQYRDKFGLYHNQRLSNKEYQQLMRGYVDKYYKQVVKKNLIKGGKNTRTNNKVLPGRRIGNNKIKEVKYE